VSGVSQVVERIKAVPGEVTFLVVDPSTDTFFRDKKIIITGDMDNIERIGDEVEAAAPVEAAEQPAVKPVGSSDDSSMHGVDVNETVVVDEEGVISSGAEQVSAFSVTGRQLVTYFTCCCRCDYVSTSET